MAFVRVTLSLSHRGKRSKPKRGRSGPDARVMVEGRSLHRI
jgi:hypothetical protein